MELRGVILQLVVVVVGCEVLAYREYVTAEPVFCGSWVIGFFFGVVVISLLLVLGLYNVLRSFISRLLAFFVLLMAERVIPTASGFGI